MMQFAVETRGFCFPQNVKQVPGPTQPPIQRIIRAVLPNVSSQDVKLTTQLDLVVRAKMNGEIPPLPNKPARCADGRHFTFCVTDRGVKVNMSTFIQPCH